MEGQARAMGSQGKRLIALPLFGIGDVLMTTPALRNISERTDASLTYIHMFNPTMQVLQGNPHVAENIHFPFIDAGRLASMRFLLSMRGRFHASINFYPSNRRDYTLAAFVVGCPERIGHRYLRKDLAELNFLKNRTVKEDDSLHNVQESLRLLKFLGIDDPKPYPMEMFLSPEEKSRAAGWIRERGLEGRTLVGVHPGTSSFKDQYKRRWPAGRFASFMREAASAYPDITFVLFGGPEEAALRQEIMGGAALGARGAVSAETSSIRDSISLIGECSYFVSNDSGLMHAAAAMQVPTVAIFGPTDPAYVRPWKCRHRVVRKSGGCGPCFRYTPAPLKCAKGGLFPCVQDIEAADVLGALASLMAGESDQA